MINIANPAEECNRILPATKNNTASAESASRSITNGSGEDKWLFFNPELAEKTDITFAVVCYGIYLWIKTPAKGIFKKPTIEDKPAAFRSGRQLESEYPWWNHTTIWKAIGRGEIKLKGQFLVDREKTPLHFAMSPKLMKMHESKTGLLGFLKSDALKYGAWPAVLLSNLRHQLAEFINPLKDDDGNKYGELSPTKLTEIRDDNIGNQRPILPIKYDRAVDVIRELKKAGAIIPHPSRKGFYRLPNDHPISGKHSNRSVGKVNSNVGKVNKTVGKVNSKNVVGVRNMRNNNDLWTISETLDSNIDSNVDRKCLLPPTSPLRCHVEGNEASLSFGAKKLISIIKDELIRQRDKAVPSSKINNYAVYEVHDVDKTTLIGYEFDYDWLPVEQSTGKTYSRTREIDVALNQLKGLLRNKGWKYSRDDIMKFQQMFEAHSSLTYEHVEALVNFTCPQSNPLIIENKTLIGKGYDWAYFARRIRTLNQFFKYLPQLVREYYMAELSEQTYFDKGEDGMPICEYHKMPSPFMELAFKNDTPEWNDRSMKTPTTYRKEGAYIITTHGRNGDVISSSTPIDNGTDYCTPIKEYVEHDTNPLIDDYGEHLMSA